MIWRQLISCFVLHAHSPLGNVMWKLKRRTVSGTRGRALLPHQMAVMKDGYEYSLQGSSPLRLFLSCSEKHLPAWQTSTHVPSQAGCLPARLRPGPLSFHFTLLRGQMLTASTMENRRKRDAAKWKHIPVYKAFLANEQDYNSLRSC